MKLKQSETSVSTTIELDERRDAADAEKESSKRGRPGMNWNWGEYKFGLGTIERSKAKKTKLQCLQKNYFKFKKNLVMKAAERSFKTNN